MGGRHTKERDTSHSTNEHTISRPNVQSYHVQARSHPIEHSNDSSTDSYGYMQHSSRSNEIHKGLHNEANAYHCFINVIIQSLWHLNSWRRRFEALDYNHVHHIDPCIHCALKAIFIAFEYSDSSIIPPDQLRQALNDGDLQAAQDRFRLGSMGDAEEALDQILRWLHSEQVTRANEDVTDDDFHADRPCTPTCISHVVFGGQYVDCRVCSTCSSVGDPAPMSSFLYRVYAGELLAQFVDDVSGQPLPSFEDRLKRIYKATRYSCSNDAESKCPGPALIDRWLLQQPLVFALMFVWPPEVNREDISLIWSVLPHNLQINRFLRTHIDSPDPPVYCLRGVVGFYGQHYMAFFWSISHQCWLMFDDRRVVRVGDWFDLCQRVTAGKIRPILVFYETSEDVGSLSDTRSLAASMANVRIERTNQTSSTSSSSDPHRVLAPLQVGDDVFGDLHALEYATPRETQTQIATTRRR